MPLFQLLNSQRPRRTTGSRHARARILRSGAPSRELRYKCLAIAARDTVFTDDLDAGWKFSSGSTRVNDTNEAVHAGGYTVVPVGGTAEVSFVGSGASVYFVTPANTQGSWDFFFDGESIGGVEIVRPIPEISYNERLLSSHGHPVGPHSIKIVARSAVCGVDTLFYNPGPASPDDPDD